MKFSFEIRSIKNTWDNKDFDGVVINKVTSKRRRQWRREGMIIVCVGGGVETCRNPTV